MKPTNALAASIIIAITLVTCASIYLTAMTSIPTAQDVKIQEAIQEWQKGTAKFLSNCFKCKFATTIQDAISAEKILLSPEQQSLFEPKLPAFTPSPQPITQLPLPTEQISTWKCQNCQNNNLNYQLICTNCYWPKPSSPPIVHTTEEKEKIKELNQKFPTAASITKEIDTALYEVFQNTKLHEAARSARSIKNVEHPFEILLNLPGITEQQKKQIFDIGTKATVFEPDNISYNTLISYYIDRLANDYDDYGKAKALIEKIKSPERAQEKSSLMLRLEEAHEAKKREAAQKK